MASIWLEEPVAAPADLAWAALRHVGMAHQLFSPVLVDSTVEGDIRTVTFANGMVVRERIIAVDEQRRQVFGHVADSNIHIDVARRDMDEGIKKAVRWLGYDLVTRLGGSISAEHGVGRMKRPYLPLSRTEPELGLMAVM